LEGSVVAAVRATLLAIGGHDHDTLGSPLALTAHIAASVGWLGAVAGFLALSIAGLTSQDVQTVRAAYLDGRDRVVRACPVEPRLVG
jgi:hypothetical protein